METKVKPKHEFWKYFWRTIKEGKYLLFKYVAVAVLMSVISILANLLQVEELTYLNAFLALNCFSSLVAFGVQGGINIMVNQSINSKFRVRKYVRIGSEINAVFMVLLTAVLVAFPRFIMESVTGYIPQDYTFYYLMCIYFFLCGIKEYVVDSLKELQIFKGQFISECLTYLVTLIGFVVLYFAGIYYLNYIAIVYIVSTLIATIVAMFILRYNKIMPINILKIERVHLTSAQWKMIVSNFAVEFIWQIGYFATSVLFLRMSDAMLNTYSYLENVLDIFNGFLFAYVNVTCIKIARALGRNAFDRAQVHAKYSIYGTLVIWLFYFVASCLFIYPISLGVNSEYFSIMFYVLPCYVLLHLFRFLVWNFSSYMLRLGGKITIHVVLETIKTIVFVVFCFIVQYFPDNIFFSYFIVALPDIVALPIEYFIYKRKKWIANVNEDEKLLRNKVKCFVFDFDDTLYYGVKLDTWKQMALNYFNEHFSYLSEKERKDIFKKYNCGKNGQEVYRHLKQIMVEVEGSCEAWINFKTGFEVQPEEKSGKAISMKELKKCAELGHLYIVSNSSRREIEDKANIYGIDLEIFTDIYCNDTYGAEEDKGVYYKKIMEREALTPDKIIVVGDKYKTDLKPAKLLKMNVFKPDMGFTFEELLG